MKKMTITNIIWIKMIKKENLKHLSVFSYQVFLIFNIEVCLIILFIYQFLFKVVEKLGMSSMN
jgi:hypothetical protein